MPADDIERAAIALVTEYLTERHAWERDAWAMWRRARTSETSERITASFGERLGRFFEEPACAPTSFGSVPGVDLATTDFIGVTRRRGRIVVATREVALPGFEVRAFNEYILNEVDGRPRIADIRAEVDPGEWISLMRKGAAPAKS